MFQARSHTRITGTRSLSGRRLPKLLVALAATSGALLAGGAPAHALVVEDAPSCDNQPLSKPFTPWLDYADYTPIPSGSFENGSDGWSLSGGAGVGGGNEPWNVAEDDGTKSLHLPPGSRAVSPTMCVGLEHPTLRFFADRNGGSMLSTLAVAVRVRTALGLVVELPVGVHLSLSGQWTPTVPNIVVANLLPLLPGDYTPVEFTFTSVGNSTWKVDDTYVDPWGKG